jgi:hypothetical protein
VGFTARIALVVISLQIAALDHHFEIADVVGVEGTSAHTLHCHDDLARCADGGSSAVMAIPDAFSLPREVTRPLALESHALRPQAIATRSEPEPPRL